MGRLTSPLAATSLVSLAAALLVAACVGPSRFFPENRSLVGIPPDKIVVVWSHGSRADRKPDYCAPDGGALFGYAAVPASVLGLADEPDILVLADCQFPRGHKGAAKLEAERYQPCDSLEPTTGDSYKEIKVCRRADDLRRLIIELGRSVPPDHIFLAGASAGAWASLLVARDPDRRFNAVIGFAPAFAGHEEDRSDSWQAVNEEHYRYLETAPRLPALVFAFAGDPYEDPDRLARLGNLPELQLVTFPGEGSDRSCGFGLDNPFGGAHRCADALWMPGVATPMMRDYIRCRVADPHGECRVSPPQG
jgi:pimeloyl-ACP methyl ester carboxylesterase